VVKRLFSALIFSLFLNDGVLAQSLQTPPITPASIETEDSDTEPSSEDDLSEEPGPEAGLPDLDSLQDQLDLQSFEHLSLQQRFADFRKALPFDFFGSLAVRHCAMANDKLNVLGNVLQMRLSAGVRGQFDSHWSYGLRVLSTQNDSFNLSWFPTGGSSIARVPFFIDRYHMTWQRQPESGETFIPALQLDFGKSRNTLFETQLLFDEDVSFNGLQQHLRWKNPEQSTTALSTGFDWDTAEVSFHENILLIEETFITASLWAAKALGRWRVPDGSAQISAAYLHYVGTDALAAQTYNPGYRGPYSTGNRRQQGRVPGFLHDFRLLDLSAQWQWQPQAWPEMQVMGDLVYNTAAPDRNLGAWIGGHIGNLRKPGDWQVEYAYRWMEQDYQLDLMVDEFFAGTDVQGHSVNVNYMLAEKTRATATLLTRQRITEPELGMLTILYLTLRQDF
jgi:hypothetical protein